MERERERDRETHTHTHARKKLTVDSKSCTDVGPASVAVGGVGCMCSNFLASTCTAESLKLFL